MSEQKDEIKINNDTKPSQSRLKVKHSGRKKEWEDIIKNTMPEVKEVIFEIEDDEIIEFEREEIPEFTEEEILKLKERRKNEKWYRLEISLIPQSSEDEEDEEDEEDKEEQCQG